MRDDHAQDVIAALAEDPPSMNGRFGEHDMTILGLAAKYDRFSICRWLLGRGFKLNDRDALGRSPLHIAVEHNSLFALREMCQYQFRNGSVRGMAQILDMRCTDGRTILELSGYRPATACGGGAASPGESAGTPQTAASMNGTPQASKLSTGGGNAAAGQRYQATPSDSGLGAPLRSPGADSLLHGGIDEGSSDDESGVFANGDVAREDDLEKLAFDDDPSTGSKTRSTTSSRKPSTLGKGSRKSSHRAAAAANGDAEEAPDDAMLDTASGSASASGSNPRLTHRDAAAVSNDGSNDTRMHMSEPIIATGAPTLNYLLSVDHPPATNPRQHSPALVHHFTKSVRRYVRRAAGADGGNNAGSRSRPVILLCAAGHHLPELVPHSFLAPSMFLDRRIRMEELTHLITNNNLDREWRSILPDVNLSYRANFGLVSAPADGSPVLHTPRTRRRHRQLMVHETLLTPLLVATYCGCIGVIKQLIILGGRSQLLVSDTCGNNVVHYAVDHFCRSGSDRVLRFVLTYLQETSDLVFKTNTNGHRPGEFNADEADDLEIMSASEEPLPAIPSAISFKHRSMNAASSPPPLADVPSMMVRSAMTAAPTTPGGQLVSPNAPPIRTGTQPGASSTTLSGIQQASSDHHPLASNVRDADGLIADVHSESDEDGSEASADGANGPVDEAGVPIRRSGRGRSNVGPSSTPQGEQPSTADEPRDVTIVDETTGEVTTAGSVRRNKRRSASKPPPKVSIEPPGVIPDANEELVESGDGGAPPLLSGDDGDDAQQQHTPRHFGAPVDGRSPALGIRQPDRNVLPCLRQHELRKMLHLD